MPHPTRNDYHLMMQMEEDQGEEPSFGSTDMVCLKDRSRCCPDDKSCCQNDPEDGDYSDILDTLNDAPGG